MEKMRKTMTTIFAIAILIIPTVSIAGSLEPPPGSVGPSGPVPTMKTLDELIPAWSRYIQGPDRLQLALSGGGDAWLDKDTGLVWTMPSTPPRTWHSARYQCYVSNIGGVWGWRLPSVEELASIGRTTNIWGFLEGNNYSFWTSTTADTPTDGTAAYRVAFYYDPANDDIKIMFLDPQYKTNTTINGAWCVRGGHGYDGR